MDTLVPHIVRKITFQKPDTAKRFIELYEKFIRENGLHLDIFYLNESLVHEPFTLSLQK